MSGNCEKRSQDCEDTDSKIKALILDIEGTTTSISFVKDTLFPYIRENLKKYLNDHWKESEFLEDLGLLREQAACDAKDSIDGFVPIPSDENEEKLREAVLKNILWQMDLDRKTKALKQLQGHVMQQGYHEGKLKGHIYDDVQPALQAWNHGGRQVYVYSSGSVAAQKLLFGHSEKGDLLEFFAGHFDTEVGPKVESESYKTIAGKVNCKSEEIMFLTDVPGEAKAARDAGLNAVLVSRPGNADLSEEDSMNFRVIKSFHDIVFESSAKRKKLSSSEDKDMGKPSTVEENQDMKMDVDEDVNSKVSSDADMKVPESNDLKNEERVEIKENGKMEVQDEKRMGEKSESGVKADDAKPIVDSEPKESPVTEKPSDSKEEDKSEDRNIENGLEIADAEKASNTKTGDEELVKESVDTTPSSNCESKEESGEAKTSDEIEDCKTTETKEDEKTPESKLDKNTIDAGSKAKDEGEAKVTESKPPQNEKVEECVTADKSEVMETEVRQESVKVVKESEKVEKEEDKTKVVEEEETASTKKEPKKKTEEAAEEKNVRERKENTEETKIKKPAESNETEETVQAKKDKVDDTEDNTEKAENKKIEKTTEDTQTEAKVEGEKTETESKATPVEPMEDETEAPKIENKTEEPVKDKTAESIPEGKTAESIPEGKTAENLPEGKTAEETTKTVEKVSEEKTVESTDKTSDSIPNGTVTDTPAPKQDSVVDSQTDKSDEKEKEEPKEPKESKEDEKKIANDETTQKSSADESKGNEDVCEKSGENSKSPSTETKAEITSENNVEHKPKDVTESDETVKSKVEPGDTNDKIPEKNNSAADEAMEVESAETSTDAGNAKMDVDEVSKPVGEATENMPSEDNTADKSPAKEKELGGGDNKANGICDKDGMEVCNEEKAMNGSGDATEEVKVKKIMETTKTEAVAAPSAES